MRQTRLNDAALVLTSALWQVNAVALQLADGATVLVDSLVLPGELEELPGVLKEAGLEPEALVVTHAHFDHVLGRAAYPGLPLLAGADTAALLRDDAGGVLRELEESDAELYLDRRVLPRLDGAQDAGGLALERVDAAGHAAEGSAYFDPSLGVLLAGDYLIEIEIPLVSAAGSPEAYLATLDRLAPLVARAEVVVPGHGPPLSRERALELLELDRRYVSDLASGPVRGSGDRRQRRIHEDNVRKHRDLAGRH